MGEATAFDLFPVNGLDRSLHTPVLVGLLFLAFFSETLGWTFAGLVVPGYFASVIIAAPATAVLVLVEAIVTYAVCALLGRWIPRTGVWSTAFGRERFFLFIVTGLAVRLALEANLLPYLEGQLDLPHSRELHSLGLVLVPLLANMFWNAGLWRSLPRVVLLTALTYAVVDGILLEYTNFTVSRFEVANESVSLAFLETPHAQLILLIGALLAARANVMYGWDYNGILVPALLAVAWYQPTKLLTTVVEALAVYGCARGLAAVPPLSSVLVVGTRRVVLTYGVGFVLKWLIGATMMQVNPRIHMVDFLGFGYLLPTLLAVKMWNRDAIGTVLVPTLQVSVVAFVVGNLAGYGLAYLHGSGLSRGERTDVPTTAHHPAFELMLGHTAPAPSVNSAELAARSRLARVAVDRLLSGIPFDQQLLDDAARLHVSLRQPEGPGGEYLVMRPFSTQPDADQAAPRFAVHMRPDEAAPWMVVARVSRVGSPSFAVATEMARLLDARAIAVHAVTGPAGDYDASFNASLARQLDIEHVLRVEAGGPAELVVVSELPAAVDVQELEHIADTELRLRWDRYRSPRSPLDNATTLRLPSPVAERLAARVLGSPETLVWPAGIGAALGERFEALTDVRPFAFENPSIEELRLFRARLAPAFLALGERGEPSAWQRALAKQLRYRFVRIRAPASGGVGWALIEPPGRGRRGNATWVRRPRGAREVLVEAPAVRWEIGTMRAAFMAVSGFDARGLLIPGALPNASPDGGADVRYSSGVQSFYHVIHQSWLDAGGHAVAMHGIAPERGAPRDVVLSLGREVSRAARLPAWTHPVRDFFSDSGFEPAVVDGSLELAPFEGSHDPAMGYAKRFAPDSALMVWLSPRLRTRLVSMQEDDRVARRLARLRTTVAKADPAERALELLACFQRGKDKTERGDCPRPERYPRCDVPSAAREFERYTHSRNPHRLRSALDKARRCRLQLVQDSESQLLWALVAGPRDGWLIPLRGGPVRRAPAVRDRRALERVLSTGLASARLEAGS